MRPNRIAATVAAATLLALPAAATAAESPLLSGYGGPGAGEQQLIGATLVGGHGGGGPSSGRKGPSSGSGATEGGEATVAPSEASGGSQEGSGSPEGSVTRREGSGRGGSHSGQIAGGPHRGGHAKAGKQGRESVGSSPQAKSSKQPSQTSQPRLQIPLSARNAASQSLALGLSGSQLLLVVLLALGLLLVGLATRRLARLESRRDPADTDVMKSASR